MFPLRSCFHADPSPSLLTTNLSSFFLFVVVFFSSFGKAHANGGLILTDEEVAVQMAQLYGEDRGGAQQAPPAKRVVRRAARWKNDQPRIVQRADDDAAGETRRKRVRREKVSAGFVDPTLVDLGDEWSVVGGSDQSFEPSDMASNNDEDDLDLESSADVVKDRKKRAAATPAPGQKPFFPFF